MELTTKQIEGIKYYKLGKIIKAINCFESSSKENINNELTHESLGICYMEIGEYQQSIENFNKVLDLNSKNEKAIFSIIHLLNFIKPKNSEKNNIFSTNEKILSLNNNLREKISDVDTIKEIFEKADCYIDENCNEINYKETQIFRRDNKKLDCDRHFKVFNKFSIIPKYCFSCYKIQIIVKDVLELIKLYFLFNQSFIKKSILRKCMIEIRPNIKGNYKGFVYFDNLEDSTETLEIIKKKIQETKIETKSVQIKHGCSEFYKKFPDFESINFKGKQKINYDEKWSKYEKIIDNESVIRDNTFVGATLNKLTLADFFILKNWLIYAELLGDSSYEKVFPKKLKNNFLNKILKEQYEFRKNEL